MSNEERYNSKLFIDFGIDIKNRKFLLDEEIDDDLASLFIKAMELMVHKKEPITIIMNSSGGDVYAGFSIIDSIRQAQKRGCSVTIIVQGVSMSMAAIILAVGNKRLATESSQIMIHQGQHFIVGRFDETKIEAKQNEKLEYICNGILAKHCKQDLGYIEKLQEKGNFYMDAKKALKFGIIDQII